MESSEGNSQDAPMVTVKSGVLQGCVKYAVGSSTPVYSYLGVPYAKPPVGDLRLRPPVPPEPWTGVRNATSIGHCAPQDLASTKQSFSPVPILDEDTSEDCLFVNIYSPDVQGNNPVLFWIHGGSFCRGMAHLYDGTAYAALENLVVVTVGYRLGALAFLHTGDSECPGNYGLLDQVAALQWVADNIRAFGGDPSSVTIAGESAGAISVQLLLLSPLTKGLFHRAISQSAAALIPNFINNATAKQNALDLSKEMGCDAADSKTLVEFLRNVDVQKLIAAQTKFLKKQVYFTPSVDGHFLHEHPSTSYASGEVDRVPHLVGVNSDEGYYFAMTRYPPCLEDNFDRDGCVKCVHSVAKLLYPDAPPEVLQIILDLYFNDGKNRQTVDDWRALAGDMFGEAFLTAPTVLSADYHSRVAKTFLCLFAHKPSFSIYPTVPAGAAHAEELSFSWGDAFMDRPINKRVSFTEEEKTLSRSFMKYWANFIRHGDPSIGRGTLPHWPQFNETDQKYLVLDTQIEARNHFKHDKMQLWNETVPKHMTSK